jgi:hypothetical protein
MKEECYPLGPECSEIMYIENINLIFPKMRCLGIVMNNGYSNSKVYRSKNFNNKKKSALHLYISTAFKYIM